ncbi:programmed cell death protein 2-like [Stegodyphus dumicola]|uniref:programmed cell death protein 2-like n=1 Tax=Stegodyphus dumicola TaxID=202533 RepID=UPI0015AA09FF|nr:programmed cell death protein 2-like [Stegodyphus dumicola]
MASQSVELGFADKRASWKLSSKYFPSKIGGKPAWLRLKDLPNPADLLCKKCEKPLAFLLQVYAPVAEKEDTFHRTIFVFMCLNGKCHQRFSNSSFAVFRNQLPRQNEFYSYDPPILNEKSCNDPSAEQFQPICDVCGCMSAISCEKCSERNYCSEEHRKCDWEWNHKNMCGNNDGTKKHKKLKSQFLLPEFELVTETEELPSVTAEKSDEEKMREYHQFMQSSKAPRELQDVRVDDLDIVVKKKDKAFNKFQKRIKIEPEQVLRYQRRGEPLWVSSEHVPSEKDIPVCSCGAKRAFEFQVMPQLLNFLSLDSVEDSVDWGTLIVYTCSESCERGTGAYVKEFLWKQDFSNDRS